MKQLREACFGHPPRVEAAAAALAQTMRMAAELSKPPRVPAFKREDGALDQDPRISVRTATC